MSPMLAQLGQLRVPSGRIPSRLLRQYFAYPTSNQDPTVAKKQKRKLQLGHQLEISAEHVQKTSVNPSIDEDVTVQYGGPVGNAENEGHGGGAKELGNRYKSR
jgi:hypothetical protein